MTKPFNHLGIVGSGTMGLGIAQLAALSGLPTILCDIDAAALEKALTRIHQSVETGIQKGKLAADAVSQITANLKTTTDMDAMAGVVDLVIEAVPENLALKQQIFRQLDRVAPPDTCFASNTSSLSITALAAVTQRPAQVAGMHFFNPVPVMKLVEVIQGQETAAELMTRLCFLAKLLGKTPVRTKDSPGFIVNRVARSYYGEALRLLDEGTASIECIDTILQEEGGFAMGPFRLMDLIGIDVNYQVSQSVYDAYFQDARFQPHPLQRRMVEAGHLGRKTGQGFYQYGD